MATQNPLLKLEEFGQSIWLDFLGRSLVRSGQLRNLIEDDGLSGITSNPTIFQKAIGQSGAYDSDIRRHRKDGRSAVEIYETLAIGDIQEAADTLRPVYDETHGADGYVSLEVSPKLAHDAEKTIEEAKRLWGAVARKNVMIKIPATSEGLQAITACTAEGINVNVTLLFGLDRYRQVTDAYIGGLEERVKRGGNLGPIHSVASFFLSRIDVLLDPILKGRDGGEGVRGEVSIASAKLAYEVYQQVFGGDRFHNLERHGAHRQRLLWGSTSTKSKEDSDVKYVEALIGPETVNTLPLETLEAYRDHGSPALRLNSDLDAAHSTMAKLSDLGVDLNAATRQLEAEGVEKFSKSLDELLRGIDQKAGSLMAA
jgi:transaldolase/transaldolase/glucose-6-phosphate isomerase